MNGAAPHHHWGGQILKHTQCCAVSSDVALSTERGASHLRARCARCDHTFDGELQPAAPPSTPAPPSPTSWLGANLACLLLLSASLGRGLKMPFSSTPFCSILCVAVQSFPPAAGVLRTAADASTPRGSASCADPRGVLLPFLKASRFKELYVLRHERTLQLHESLLPHTASIRATVLRRLIDCGLQLLLA